MFDFFYAIGAKASTIFLSVALLFGVTSPQSVTLPLDAASTPALQEIVLDEQTNLRQKNVLEESKTIEQPIQSISAPTFTADLPQAQPASLQDNYQVCKEGYGKNSTWSESLNSCTCVEGYDVSANGKTCVQIQIVQQPDLSINDSACKTAVANLESFQKRYAGLYAGSLSTGSARIAEANAANYTKQYNVELPVYQLVAEAACKMPRTHRECQASVEKFNAFLAKNHFGVGNSGLAYLQFPAYQTEVYYACQ